MSPPVSQSPPPVRLYLASGSARRRALLSQLVADFSCVTADIDESPRAGEQAVDYVQRLSLAKAQCGMAHLDCLQAPAAVVLAADTIVSKDGALLGKPAGLAEFRQMMHRLSAGEHQVYTGLSVGNQGGFDTLCVATRVWFRQIGDEEIGAYWGSGEPVDKAGGYAIQGLASRFVIRIDGSYTAVVGLPLPEAELLLRGKGILSDWTYRA